MAIRDPGEGERDGAKGHVEQPAPQSAFDEARPADRLFSVILGRENPAVDADIEARLTRELKFDPDLWIIEVEDRTGRNFLDGAVV